MNMNDLLKALMAPGGQQPAQGAAGDDPLAGILGALLGGAGAGATQQPGGGGLEDILGGLLGGAGAGAAQQPSGGGLEDILGGLLGGAGAGAAQQPGGGGLEDILGGLLGGAGAGAAQQPGGGGLEDILGGLLGGAGQAQAFRSRRALPSEQRVRVVCCKPSSRFWVVARSLLASSKAWPPSLVCLRPWRRWLSLLC